ncbi:cation:proton antiporter [Pseudorhodoplanes sp.]|uniref:cation:proton antiporter domain-containing protein n=1 Tax=Pseudorhodoplanes sp. TaxID=1934341 RepID=UPI003D13141F
MLHAEHLKGILIFLVAAGILVPLLHRFVGTVLAFLLIGLVLGPFGIGYLDDHYPILRYITLEDPKAAEPLAELGVVFLLFLLGMELSLPRLWQLRRYVLGVGLLQVGVCIVVIGTIIRMSGITPPAGLILGMCFALSSTAIVMQLLVEQHRAATPVGRVALSVLLFQDLCVVPVLFTIGILEARSAGDKSLFDLLLPFAQAFAAVALIMVIGRYVVTPLIRSAARTGSRELIMAITLTIVVGISAATGASGLSVALGAFLAGLLLSDSEYRHQIEVDLDPFKGLLLGIFFVTVGMVIDLKVVWQHIGWILLSLIGLVAIKALALYGAARLFRVERPIAAEVALLLAQGGEFAFIVIGLASAKGLLHPELATSAIAVAGLSMMVTPVLAKAARALGERLEPMEHEHHSPDAGMSEMRDHVIIGGFGRVGQTVARVLDTENVPWIAFDTNGALVTEHREKDRPVYFGDASRHEILHHAGVRKARAFIVTLGSADATERMVMEITKLRPKACVLARAKDSEHATRLTKLGATDAIPEAVEASLQLAGRLLENLDFPEDVADRRIADIRNLEVAAVWRAAKKSRKSEKGAKTDEAAAE